MAGAINSYDARAAFALVCASLARLAEAAAEIPNLPPIERAQANALAALATMHMHAVVGQPDDSDAPAIIDDLLGIAAAIDPLIAAIGSEARSNFGMRRADYTDHFCDVLRGALEGNATYAVEAAAEEYFRNELDAVEDLIRDARRDPAAQAAE